MDIYNANGDCVRLPEGSKIIHQTEDWVIFASPLTSQEIERGRAIAKKHGIEGCLPGEEKR